MYALTLTTALGLGLAIDCSLFVVSRHREELRAGYATGTYRGTGSATQLGCEHGKLVLPPRCSLRLAGFNVDGATSPKVIPWDSGGRQ